MKKKLFVVLIIATFLSSNAYAKEGKQDKISSCELLNNKYEDLDCVDASTTGSICNSDEEIISLPRKSQLCCCFRNSSSSEEFSDEGDTEPVDGEPFNEEIDNEEEGSDGEGEFGFKKHHGKH